VYRIKEIYKGPPEECRYVFDDAPPWWWPITIVNILPFVSACMAWLRTLVDCVLVRWGKALNFAYWKAFAPFYLIFAVPMLIGKRLETCILFCMGRKRKTAPDVEMDRLTASEEEQALMRRPEDQAEDDDTTMYSPRGSLDSRKVVDSLDGLA
jgi:hypothetical protein